MSAGFGVQSLRFTVEKLVQFCLPASWGFRIEVQACEIYAMMQRLCAPGLLFLTSIFASCAVLVMVMTFTVCRFLNLNPKP